MKMTITIPVPSLKVTFEWLTQFKLCYCFDPDTNGKSLYLWDYKKHQVIRKLLKIRRGVARA